MVKEDYKNVVIASLLSSSCYALRCRAALVALLVTLSPTLLRAEVIRIHATNVAAKAIASAASKLKDQGVELKIATEGGSSTGIAALANDLVEIAITIRNITPQERSAAPQKRFIEETVAYQALALIVPDDVWAGGVKALTKEQMTQIYEGRLKNWKDVGGEDRPIKFYNPEQGQGVWEPFVTWLYGDVRKAGLGSNFDVVRTPEEARDTVEFNRGSLSVAPPRFANGKGVFALGIKVEGGDIVQPTLAEMASQKYPLSRPIVAIVGGRPTGTLKRVFDFFMSPEGQELFGKIGLVPAVAEAKE